MARNPIKILIVDDDQDVLIELDHLREGDGYSTATDWSDRRRLRCQKSRSLISCAWMADVDPHALFDELVTRQPNAFRFLMHSPKENIPSPSDAEVCKWETRR